MKTNVDSTGGTHNPEATERGGKVPRADALAKNFDGGTFEQLLARGEGGAKAAVVEEGAETRNTLPAPNLDFAHVPVETQTTAAPPSTSAARQTLIEELVRAIRTLAARGDEQMSFDLETGELGLKRVQLVREGDGQLGIVLRASPDAQVPELHRFRAELVEALRAQGLTIKSAQIAAASVAAGAGTTADGERAGHPRRDRSNESGARRARPRPNREVGPVDRRVDRSVDSEEVAG